MSPSIFIGITVDATTIASKIGLGAGPEQEMCIVGGAWSRNKVAYFTFLQLIDGGRIPVAASAMSRAKYMMQILVKRCDSSTQCFGFVHLPLLAESMPAAEYLAIIDEAASVLEEVGLRNTFVAYDGASYAATVNGRLQGDELADLPDESSAPRSFFRSLKPMADWHPIPHCPYKPMVGADGFPP